MIRVSIPIAVDLGSSTIKMMDRTGGKKLKVDSIGRKSIPPGVIERGEIKNVDALVEAVLSLKKQFHLHVRLYLKNHNLYILTFLRTQLQFLELAYYLYSPRCRTLDNISLEVCVINFSLTNSGSFQKNWTTVKNCSISYVTSIPNHRSSVA